MKIICFSATVSFSAGVALLAVGAITVRRTGTRAEVPYAAIPLIFGTQQLVEGGLWLSLPEPGPTTQMLTIVYLLFSNVLWPLYVPLAIWTLEPKASRRRIILLSVTAGAATSIFFLVAIITRPASAMITGAHIEYHLPHPHDTIAFTLYAAATCLAPLLSSQKMVRWFGAVLVGSMIAAYGIYATWFVSVWCFFAALASGIVFLHFSAQHAPRTTGSVTRPR